MAITYVGGQVGGRAGATSTSNVTFALTGGSDTTPKVGDLVVIGCTVASQARTPACAISGYTSGTQQNANGTTYDTSLNKSWKFMGLTPDTTFTLPSTGNIADAQRYTVQVWRGVDPLNPFDVADVVATGTGTGRPNPGSITPTTSGAVVGIIGAGAAATGAAYTAPANYTTNFRTGTTADTNDAMIGSGYRAWTSGAEDPAGYTGGTTNAADSWAAFTYALRPEVSYLPTLISTETIALGTSATPGAQNLTVPSDAQLVVVHAANYASAGDSTLSLSSNFAGTFTVYNDGDTFGDSVYVAYALVSSTGAKTITPTWSNALTGGPLFFVSYIKDIDTAAYLRDAGVYSTGSSSATASDTLATRANDLLLVLDKDGASLPGAISGYSSQATQTNNAEYGRLQTCNAPGASATTITTVGTNYACLGAIALRGIEHSSSVDGTLSVTESGDTLSSDGTVTVSSSGDIAESADTLSASGTVSSGGAIGADLSVTESNDTASASATVALSATLAKTEAADTLSSTVTVPISATSSLTDSADTISSAASVIVSATVANTDSPDTIAASGAVTIGTTLAKTEAADTVSSAATVAITATLAVTETADSVSASASVPLSATFAISETGDSLASAATVAIAASLSVTESADTLAASGTIIDGVNASLSVTESADTLSASASVPLSASLSYTEASDSVSGSAAVTINATATLTEAGDSVSGVSIVSITATASIAESADSLSASGTVESGVIATLNASEASDTLAAVANAAISATLSATESGDTLAAQASVALSAALDAVDAGDTVVSSVGISVTCSASLSESGDTLTATATIVTPSALTLSEAAILAIAEAVWARQLPLSTSPPVSYGETGLSADDLDAISHAIWSRSL